MPEITGGSLHARFFVLAGLIRHEYWLHQRSADDSGFVADVDAMTLRARRHDGSTGCVLTVTEKDLAGDLHALATHFYKDLCGGHGNLARRRSDRVR